MASSRTVTLRWVYGSSGDLGFQLARFRFAQPVPTWQPAINAYVCEQCVRVCVDLAGVDRSLIDVRVEEQRVSINGVREVPEPSSAEGRAVQTLAMEIDYGPFHREVHLPAKVEVSKVHAEQRNGFLWIYLPLKKP